MSSNELQQEEVDIPKSEDNEPEYLPGIISVNWEKFHQIEKRFKTIYHHSKRYGMIDRLNDLRMASCGWDDKICDHAPRQPYLDMLLKVEEMSKQVVRFCYNGDFMAADDAEEVASYKKQLNDMNMILFRHARVYAKEQRPFPLSLFTPGTVAVFDVKMTSRPPRTLTVDHLSGCDMNHGLVISKEKVMEHGNPYDGFFPKSKPEVINTSHVTKIIKHVPGALKVESGRSETMADNYQKYDAVSRVGKSKNTYHTGYNNSFLAAAEIERLGILSDTNQSFNHEDMMRRLLTDAPGVKIIRANEEDWYIHTLLVRKKKFKRFVRQNMNRFLISMKEQLRLEKEYQERMNREMEDSGDYDYDD